MLWSCALLVAAAYAATPAPTVPTPYPTITPAPESKCAYGDDDRGPFALDCLQAEWLKAGCNLRGESYPSNSRRDNSDDGGAEGDAQKLDKDEYNNNENTWDAVKTLFKGLFDASSADCLGATTPNPTPAPTPSPVSKAPSPKPTLAPTTKTPAPTYNEDSVWVTLHTVESGDDMDTLKAACLNAGYRRQYDDTQYVVRVANGDKVDYVTPVGDAEVCNIFAADVDVLRAVRADGPFRAANDADKRADGSAFLVLSAVGNVLSISSRRNYSQCREIATPFGDDFAIISEQWDAQECNARGDSNGLVKGNSCDGGQDDLLVAMYIANGLYEGCDGTCLYDFSGDAAYSFDGSCWSTNVGSCSASDYAVGVAGMLCSNRCGDNDADLASWRYVEGSASCFSVSAAAAGASDACDGSINNADENAKAQSMCKGAGADNCYLKSVAADWHSKDAVWSDGSGVDYVNFVSPYEDAGYVAGSVDQVSMNAADGLWSYNDNSANQPTVCRKDANMDEDSNGQSNALNCIGDADDFEKDSVSASYPRLFAGRSGFTDGSAHGELHIVVQVPRTLFAVNFKFENSTNDIAEYQYDFDGSLWEANVYEGCRDGDDLAEACAGSPADEDACKAADNCVWHGSAGAQACSADYEYELSVPWTTFNLGGAGGVQRLDSYQQADEAAFDPNSDALDDGANHQYIFGSTLRVSAKQPLKLDIDVAAAEDDVKVNQFRKADWNRDVVVRVPMIVKFQKTVHVETNLNVIAVKFNYKTVAAIIQSIQYDTQYFQPPYAKIKLQIRTKSQYPYMMNQNVARHQLNVAMKASADEDPKTNVALVLEHLATDKNCTFSNPDHMREGDVCIQEWMLYITPQENVCYATGEYTIEYETRCFLGKEVCYMPVDADGAELTTVAFTFKIQTSKFCPVVVDEVDLAGTLSCTGRAGFKPEDEDNGPLEGPTPGQMYVQGEKLHFFATTSSQRAIIKTTKVVMVQVRQDLGGLVQTGYRAVYWDPSSVDMVIWTEDDGGDRLRDGRVDIIAGGSTTKVTLMSDDEVYGTSDTYQGQTFSETEAGFKVTLHARAFPVNIDSFGTKTIAATLEVEYEGFDGNRRRLLSVANDRLHSSAKVGVAAWKPGQLPRGDSDKASMAMTLSLYNSDVSRRTARQFAASVKGAMLNGFMADPSMRGKKVYDEQISIDVVYSEGVPIWKRPQYQGVGSDRRRLVGRSSQMLQIDFTFARSSKPDSIALNKMMEIFKKQVVMPASPMMNQEIFFGAVLHELKEIEPSNYEVVDERPGRPDGVDNFDAGLESAAGLVVPGISLLAALLAFFL